MPTGTLTCTLGVTNWHTLAQGNYEFGISRIIKSLEPYDKKLETDTWCVYKACGLVRMAAYVHAKMPPVRNRAGLRSIAECPQPERMHICPLPSKRSASLPPGRYYAKRCFLALIENLAKHMIMLTDGCFTEIMAFLTEAEKYGKDLKTNFQDAKHATRTVASEARMLKRMFLRLRD